MTENEIKTVELSMTKEQVADLNEELKKMDTRTPREQLNALAGDAGRLGITSKEAILEFVDAADKINVALGEEARTDGQAHREAKAQGKQRLEHGRHRASRESRVGRSA